MRNDTPDRAELRTVSVSVLTGIAVYQGFPTQLDQIYQPLIQGVLAALAIWGGSKIPIGGAQE